MSKIVQLGGFLFSLPSIFGSPTIEIRSSANSIKSLIARELFNKDPKKIDSKFFLATGFNRIGKAIKKEFHQLRMQKYTKNEIKDIMKVI